MYIVLVRTIKSHVLKKRYACKITASLYFTQMKNTEFLLTPEEKNCTSGF